MILSDPGHHWGPSRSNWKSPPNRDCEKENYVISIDKVGTELAQVRENNRPHCSWIIFEEKVATLDKNEWLKVFFGKKWKRIDSIGRHSGRISGIILQIIPFDSQQSEVERWNIHIFIYISNDIQIQWIQLWMENFWETSFLFVISYAFHDITFTCRSFCTLRKMELRLYFGQANPYN